MYLFKRIASIHKKRKKKKRRGALAGAFLFASMAFHIQKAAMSATKARNVIP